MLCQSSDQSQYSSQQMLDFCTSLCWQKENSMCVHERSRPLKLVIYRMVTTYSLEEHISTFIVNTPTKAKDDLTMVAERCGNLTLHTSTLKPRKQMQSKQCQTLHTEAETGTSTQVNEQIHVSCKKNSKVVVSRCLLFAYGRVRGEKQTYRSISLS